MSNDVDYKQLAQQVANLCDNQLPHTTNLANFSALLWCNLPDINWAGVYLFNETLNCLVLGPFQGKPACTRIPLGKGVCGKAFETRTNQLVRNVHEFEGHIACDAASMSEIVLPLYHNDKLVGVVDIDSPSLARFDEDDLAGMDRVVRTLEKSLSVRDFNSN